MPCILTSEIQKLGGLLFVTSPKASTPYSSLDGQQLHLGGRATTTIFAGFAQEV